MTHNNKAFIVSLCTVYQGFFKIENRHTIRVLDFGWMHLRKEPPLPSWKDLHESHQPWLNFFEFSFGRRKWIEWKFIKKKKKFLNFPCFEVLMKGMENLFPYLEEKCSFGKYYFCQLILLFSLFSLLFMGPTAFFGTIHGSYCIISTNFYL